MRIGVSVMKMDNIISSENSDLSKINAEGRGHQRTVG